MKTIAIYSRKSKFTGKGDSIENQIEMCKEYILKKIGNVEFLIYEDEGFGGATIERPQFKKLIRDIKSKKISALVCYRLDRISRTVADFSSTLAILQENDCDFISIKEEFDTTSPMGRAMIYIASVFAQLERETIAERVKDNMLELAKNGKWTGGKIPLGFISKRVKYNDPDGLQREYPILEINKTEMDFVEFLYKKYLELGSLHKLEIYITKNQLKSRNGIMFEKSSLKLILQNPVYVKATLEVTDYLQENNWNIYGKPDNLHSLLTYNKTEQNIKNGKYTKSLKPKTERFAAVSNIKGALDADLWLQVQRQFDKNRDTFPRLGKTHNALLVGKLKCGNCKEHMLVQHGRISKNTGEKIFYYSCSLKRKSHKKLCSNGNAKAKYVEDLVIQSLKLLATSKRDFIDKLKDAYTSTLKTNKTSIEKVSLEKSLNEKRKQIDTLVTTLSKSEGIEDIILDKIKTLKKECADIEIKIENFQDLAKHEKVKNINLKLIESIINKCEIIDTLTQDEQKEIIDVLIDCIYWYGSGNGKGKIKIKFIGTDDEDSEEVELPDDELQQQMLQFSSSSMSGIKQNYIFSKFF
ncbi:recombinase family protein [Clostridium magnum]|uniref:DNA-invertase hin n=1 Tax=Clostridium magnum DSM 2767 TaxID=1121326 RepID=A0A161Y5L2_9CLOT|nr:recombinase family protein [Clostridium magnum]KZL93519.1 DNA-invertase hin [Clostridium magnum DSM 2767]SHI27231.1 Site-specific DNA recombinase [Clostridium magnum DSM 2767]